MSDDMNEDESRSSFFPTRSSATQWQAGPIRVLEIGDEESRPVFAALSSETARAILSMVFDEPRTASTLAEEAGTSIQNAKYHLEKLEEQRLVEVVDTRYSSRGVEMAVYGPKNAAIVLFAGEVPDRTATKDLFRRPVGGRGSVDSSERAGRTRSAAERSRADYSR